MTSINEAYDALRYTQGIIDENLHEQLPEHRVDEIEVFAASVHAVVHKHEWYCHFSDTNPLNPFTVRAVFLCKHCGDKAVREIKRPYL